MLFFCDVDESGNITSFLGGKYVIPDRQYDYFFYLTDNFDVIDKPQDYQVIEGRLVKKEG